MNRPYQSFVNNSESSNTNYRNQILVQKRMNNTQMSEKAAAINRPERIAYQVNRLASERVICSPCGIWRVSRSLWRMVLSCQRVPSTSMLQMTLPSSSSYCFSFDFISYSTSAIIKMAGHGVTGFHFPGFGDHLLAYIHHLATAGVKLTAGWGIGG